MNTILIVDDEREILETLRLNFELEGYNVLLASSGSSAQAILSIRDVDLVISDVRMADGSGIELLDWIQANRLTTPTILMTGYAEVSPAEAKKRGAIALVSKPFSLKSLDELVKNTFNI